MELWEAIVLGVIQGLTEFLPLSSSGHLALSKYILGLSTDNLRFEIFVHLGTLLAVIVFFRYRLAKIARAVFKGRMYYRSGRWRFSDDNLRLLIFIILAAIPVGIAGLLLHDGIKEFFSRPELVALFLLGTGFILFSTRWSRQATGDFNWRRALTVGLAQILALLPGVSRSGVTISAGNHSGVEQGRSAEFSFLLAIPVILGAGLLGVKDLIAAGLPRQEIAPLFSGGLTAAATGFFAIKVLFRFTARRRLDFFAYYCWAAGLGSLLWLVLKGA